MPSCASLAELDAEHDEVVAGVLAVLADDRLVTIGEDEVEVAHEALLREWPRLRGWLEEDAEGRRLHRHLIHAARDWQSAGRDPGELYRGARLAAALDWSAAREPDLNATELAFLAESRAASERSHRRLQGVLISVVGLLVLAVVAGLLALEQRGNARGEAIAADAQRLGARALVESNLDRALLLARQGVALDDTVQTRSSLLATLVKSPAAIGVIRGAGERIGSVALSPDGRTLAVADELGKLLFFGARTRHRLATVEPIPADQSIFWMAYSPDGRRLAFSHSAGGLMPGFRNDTVSVLDTRRRRVIARLGTPGGFVGGLRYSGDGRTLDVVHVDTLHGDPAATSLLRFDAQTGRRLEGPVELDRSPAYVMVPSDERRLVVAGPDETTIRDARSLEVVRHLPAISPRFGFWAEISPDGRTVAAGFDDGSLRLQDLRTGDVRTASGRAAASIERLAFTPDGRRAITADGAGNVIVWDTRSAAATETLAGHAGVVHALAVGRDGTTLYSGSFDGTVIAWDLAGSRRLGRPFRAAAGRSGDFPRHALSSDGRLLAVGQPDGAVSVVDARTLTRREPFPVTSEEVLHFEGRVRQDVLGMGFVPGTHMLVVGGFGGFLALVDADSGRVIGRLSGHRGPIWTPGISADGRLMVTGSFDHTVRFWSLPDGRALGAPLRFGRRDVNDAQLSPDGRWATIVVADTLEVWDARTRRLVRRVRPADGVYGARFSLDGRLLAVGNNRGRAEVWSTADWTPVTRSFAGSAGRVDLAAISPDGRTLATGATDGTVRLWDIATEQAVGAPLPGLPDHRVIPLFTPDGSGLFVGYDNGRAYRWDIRPASLVRQACRIAGRRLTRAEWDEFLPGRDYDPACSG